MLYTRNQFKKLHEKEIEKKKEKEIETVQGYLNTSNQAGWVTNEFLKFMNFSLEEYKGLCDRKLIINKNILGSWTDPTLKLILCVLKTGTYRI